MRAEDKVGEAVPDDVTLGELSRSLGALRDEVREIRDKLDKLPDSEAVAGVATAWTQALASSEQAQDLKLQLHEAKSDAAQDALKRRVETLETWNTWVTRIVMGLVVAALVGLVLTNGGVGQ